MLQLKKLMRKMNISKGIYLLSDSGGRMLKVTLFETLVRGIPEALTMMLAMYAFANKKLEKKEYLISSLILVLVVYLIRLLPINYGIHTILNIFVLIFLAFNVNKIDLIVSIKASILILMILFLCEGLNLLFIEKFFNENIDYLFENVFTKTILGIPSTIMFMVIVTYYYLTGWYITLTGFEIVSFVLAFTWLMLLLQTLDKASREPIPVYDVDIEVKKETESKT